MKIKVKKINKNLDLPEVIDKGEWIDLRASDSIQLQAPYSNILTKGRTQRTLMFDYYKIKLGIAMKLPKGFEAVVLPRSSFFDKHNCIIANSQGVIDNSYSSNKDEWKFPVIAFEDTTIEENERVCQFRIQLSQKATFWQKLKWLFSSKIEIEEVDDLGDSNRGGFGSTGKF